jgi:imidazoleglycerol phosphate synthase glutamine amidotransferase subunit HisH
MNVVIIKYNAGNIHSVVHGLHRIGVEPLVTDDKSLIRQADKVIFWCRGSLLTNGLSQGTWVGHLE